jgi:flagellar biosynthesis/type III secretory pathway chaperone
VGEMMSIRPVIEQINQLIILHRSLLDLGIQKKDILVSNKVNELAIIMKHESNVMKQISTTEAAWRDEIIRFLEASGLKPDPQITVTEISKLVFNVEDRRALNDAQRTLLDTVDELRKVNTLNQELIEQSLTFINYSIDLYMGGSEQSTIYNNTRQTSNEYKKMGLFDRRA